MSSPDRQISLTDPDSRFEAVTGTTLQLTVGSAGQLATTASYADGISIDHRAAHGLRIALFLQVPSKEGHVLHVEPEQNVERIAHNRDRADRGVEKGVRQHSRNQPVWCAELSGFPDEIGRYQALRSRRPPPGSVR